MRVIRKSSEKEIVCPECSSVLYYTEKDIHLIGDMEGEYYYCVKCPECNNQVRVLSTTTKLNT